MTNFIYNHLLLPAADLAFHVAAPFNNKAQAAVEGRSGWEQNLERQLNAAPSGQRMLLHAPSVGEFLQGRAVLDRILDHYPDQVAIVTHFSPSARKIVTGYKRAAAHSYLPLDTRRNVRRLLEIVDPSFIAFSRADVWPNLAEEISRRQIPAALIAGSLSENSGVFSRAFLRFAGRRYQNLRFIGAISEEDAERFKKLAKCKVVILEKE